MSGYNGRRAPNVSQYLATLNHISTSQETAAQSLEAPNFDDEFALFTNMELLDFDIGGEIPQVPEQMPYDPSHEERARRQNASAYNRHSAKQQLNFMNMPPQPSNDFRFADFSGFSALSNVVPDVSTAPLPVAPPAHYPLAPYTAAPSAPVPGPSITGTKRKLDAITPTKHMTVEEASRIAAEEDKRRRNTAASARFRVKKKQREQALEKTAKEMTEKVSVLEARINQLEMENKWLKNLITEKNDGKDFAEKYREFKDQSSSDELSVQDGKHGNGVGESREALEEAAAKGEQKED